MNCIPSTVPNGSASPLKVFANLKNVSGTDLGRSDLKSLLIIVSPLGDRMKIYENIIIHMFNSGLLVLISLSASKYVDLLGLLSSNI